MKDSTLKLNNVLSIDESAIQNQLSNLVRNSVEDTLNALLDEEAKRLCNAEKFERNENRQNERAGYYTRQLETKAGKVALKVPKLRQAKFETAIIERYKRRESSVEEALMEMYLAGVSTRRIEDITEALWGNRVSAGTVSNLNEKAYVHIEAWRNRKIEGKFPYVYLDGIVLKRCWAEEVRNVSILVAIGVNTEGYRQVLGIVEGAKEDKSGWSQFLRHLKERGLEDVKLFISDACMGLIESLGEFYPQARWQRCVVHFYRNIFSFVPRGKMQDVALMLKAIHAQEDGLAASEKAFQVCKKLKEMKLHKAAELIESKIKETFTFYNFPKTHWRQIKTNNPLERMMREIRRRTRVVGNFPDGKSALMLSAARLRHIAGTRWGIKKYMNMDNLSEMNFDLNQKVA